MGPQLPPSRLVILRDIRKLTHNTFPAEVFEFWHWPLICVLSTSMPIISVFNGVVVRLFQGDHNPPHIHVRYGDFEVIVDIRTGATMKGKLPPRIQRIVLKWLEVRKKEVLKSWADAQKFKVPRKVKPLE